MFRQPTTHTTLVARLADAGDPAAWREFAERYGELIRAFARRQGLQPADCDDVLQDVLLELCRAMPRFQYDPSRGKFRSFLKTVVMRTIFRRFRQKRGATRQLNVEMEPAAASDSEIEQAWEEEWREYHLRQAMRSIEVEFDATTRAAFRAYVPEGRDAREVAASLGLSVDQVYQAKSRILKRLTRLVGQQVVEEG